jgi:hypothetical protein
MSTAITVHSVSATIAIPPPKTGEEKLVTPILMDLDGNRKVLAICVYGDEKIRLWKRCGDCYDGLYDINGNRSNIHMEVSPFFDSVAII